MTSLTHTPFVVVEEGVALAGVAVEVDAGRRVEAALAEVHALEVRLADQRC
jgi:hypothetical protein